MASSNSFQRAPRVCMALPTDSPDAPPLRRTQTCQCCEGEPLVPLRLCGFAFTFDDFVAYAEKHLPNDEEPNMKADYRRQDAMQYIKKQLNYPPISSVYGADGWMRYCVVIGSNLNQEQMANAQNPERIARFKEVLDTLDEPRWYRRISV